MAKIAQNSCIYKKNEKNIKNSFLSSKSPKWVIIRYIFSFFYYILPRENQY